MIQRYLIATILLSVILRANAFSYKDAKNWGKTYQTCNGRLQDPIIIKITTAQDFDACDQPLKFTDFKTLPTKMTIKNTGHTVEIKADWPGNPPRFSGGPLHGTYVFEKTTFHWARKGWVEEISDFPDPEFGGKIKTDLEMRLFFHRTDFKSSEEALSQKDGLAIFKVLIEVPLKKVAHLTAELGSDDPLHLIDNLEESLQKVQSPNSTATMTPIPVVSALRDDLPPLMFYRGSLDYPPCTETVAWFINDSARSTTKNVLNAFRKIKLAEGDVSNVRPPQASNNRKIWRVTPS